MAAKWIKTKTLKPPLVEMTQKLTGLLVERHKKEMQKHLDGIKTLIEMEKHKRGNK